MRPNDERGLKRAAVLFGIITALLSFLWMRSIVIGPVFKEQMSYELIRGLYIFSFNAGFLSIKQHIFCKKAHSLGFHI